MTTSDTPAAAGQPANSPLDEALVKAFATWIASKNLVFLSGEAQPIQAEAGERRFHVVHPSRTAPKCMDCAHYVLRSGIKPACNHPSQPVSVEDGQPFANPDSARREETFCTEHGRYYCGPSGLGFAPRIG